MTGYLLGANEHGHEYTCIWHVRTCMCIWVHGCMGVGFIQDTISNTQVQANRLHAQKMLSILSSIANMVGGDLYHYFMSKKSSLR